MGRQRRAPDLQGPDDPDHSGYDVAFTPDSKRLVVSQFDTGVVETLSTETWKVLVTTRPDPSAGVESLVFAGFTGDGSTLIRGGRHGAAAASLCSGSMPTRSRSGGLLRRRRHPGAAKATALSPDESLMAIGASDGILRVWDTKTGVLRQQMDFGGREVQGAAFIDDGHLAVTLQTGDLLFMAIDPAELADTVRASLTRTFTDTGVQGVRNRALPDPGAASVGELTAAHMKVQPGSRAPDRPFDAVTLGPQASTT